MTMTADAPTPPIHGRDAAGESVTAVERVLRELEWSGRGYGLPPFCPCCGLLRPHGRHAPNCPLAAALASSSAGEVEKLRARVKVLEEACIEIRDRDWVENCLDAQWAARRARAALATASQDGTREDGRG